MSKYKIAGGFVIASASFFGIQYHITKTNQLELKNILLEREVSLLKSEVDAESRKPSYEDGYSDAVIRVGNGDAFQGTYADGYKAALTVVGDGSYARGYHNAITQNAEMAKILEQKNTPSEADFKKPAEK